MTPGPARAVLTLGGATALAYLGTVIWLAAGSRAMPAEEFGQVLTAQAVYLVLALAVDLGTSYRGARLSAAGMLEQTERLGIERSRLLVAVPASGVGLAFSAIVGRDTLEAFAGYAVALPLLALFRYWEPFGRGDARPMASFFVGRAWAPAVAALPVALGSGTLPAVVPGLMECAAILVTAAAFGLRPPSLRALSGARSVPILEIAPLGVATLAAQAGVASGVFLLAMAGRPLAAGGLAVGLRLFAGISGLAASVANGLFPSTARAAGSGPRLDPGGSGANLTRGLLAIFLFTLCALATTALFATELARALLDRAGEANEAILILAAASGGATGVATILTTTLLAHGRDRALLGPVFAGAGLTLAIGVSTVAVEGSAVVLALGLAVGQLTTVLGLALRAGELGGLRRFASLAAAAALTMCLLGALAGSA